MKKSAKFTYIWNVALMAIVFIVSLIGLFLNDDHSVKSDYLFNCAQSALFLIVMTALLSVKKLELDIPNFVYIVFILFCVAHFFCGEILGFYITVPWWDSALHTFSGMLIALLSFSLVNILNKANGNGFQLNLGFMILFAFSLTITIGVLWEIVEFFSDMIFKTNMQRAYVSIVGARGEGLVGVDAISDTMKDLILDSIGAFLTCFICALFVIKKGVKVEDLSIIKKKQQNKNKSEENVTISDKKEQKTKKITKKDKKLKMTKNIEK